MGRPSTARLFVALELPEETATALRRWGREALSAWGPSVGSPRLLEREALHLTLCFLGARPFAELDALTDSLAGCAWEQAGPLEIGAPVWLPPRRPRALAVEIHDETGALASLQRLVSASLRSSCDWQPPRGRFRAHVTVIRARDGAGSATVGLPPTPALSFVPARMTLLRSHLEPTGARYELLAAYPLADVAASAQFSSSSSCATSQARMLPSLENIGSEPVSQVGSPERQL
jgi:RNA 2',3'-cyclic 3'-phosphodiesterase